MSRFGHVGQQRKSDGSLVTEADLACQQAVLSSLSERWPGVACLGEEMTAEEQAVALNQTAGPLWVLDPLDGTSNFAGHFPFFCISLALIEQGAVVFGMTHDPVRDETFWAIKGGGAWLNGQPLKLEQTPSRLGDCLAMIDHKRLPHTLVERLASHPAFHSQRSLGSVALEWCWLAAGRGSLYLHGAQKLWDYAAGRLLLAEAGGHACPLESTVPTLHPQKAIAASSEALLVDWVRYLEDGLGQSLAC